MESKSKFKASRVGLALLLLVWVPAVVFMGGVYRMELWLQAGLIALPFVGFFFLRR